VKRQYCRNDSLATALITQGDHLGNHSETSYPIWSQGVPIC